jgi:hypothetical protein
MTPDQMRGKIARIILGPNSSFNHESCRRLEDWGQYTHVANALAKADKILALLPTTDNSGEGWKPTHTHADGGDYRFVRHMDGRADQHEPWTAGVLYEGADGRFWWTGNDRWFDRFSQISPPVDVGGQTAP